MDASGAGLAMLRIHNALLEKGVESKVLVASKTSDLETVYVAIPNHNFYKFHTNRIIRFFEKRHVKRRVYSNDVEKFIKKIDQIPKEHQTGMFTFPITHYDISEHPLVLDADVVHLHWIANFVDYQSFFKKVKKPIVWTFHDYNPIMGGFHYPYYKKKYYSYYKLIDDEFYNIKKTVFEKSSNISIVAISQIMNIAINSSDFVNKIPVTIISNSVDCSKFKMLEKSSCKEALGLSHYNKVILFVSDYLNNPVKGLDLLVESLDILSLDKTVLLCVGSGKAPKSSTFDIVHFNSVNQEQLLSVFFSCADVFAMTSIEEAFGQTTIEAMACGTPVVAFPVGIANEIINDQNGVLCLENSAKGLSVGLQKALSRKYESQKIRQNIFKKFSPENIIEEYINLYKINY